MVWWMITQHKSCYWCWSCLGKAPLFLSQPWTPHKLFYQKITWSPDSAQQQWRRLTLIGLTLTAIQSRSVGTSRSWSAEVSLWKPLQFRSAPPSSAAFKHVDLTFALPSPNYFKRVQTVTSYPCSAELPYCEIRRSHSGTDKDCILACDLVWNGKQLPKFRKILVT
jgi:hypothetical protein